jgi:UDP-N-acetylmuramoyl-L-alanyl-D-glutamate--2,6-diaminopimelate ligase
MAAVAEQHSDLVVLTSDNPRSEDPLSIIRAVEKGFRGTGHETFVDRETAITRAVELAGPNDIVLVAGKGHETYQETLMGRRPFDDESVTARAMALKPFTESR